MWIIINPQKAHRFTTKGISLSKKCPTAFVEPGTDAETMAHIRKAIEDGVLIPYPNEFNDLTIEGIGAFGSVQEEDTDLKVTVTCQKDSKGRVVSDTVTIPE